MDDTDVERHRTSERQPSPEPGSAGATLERFRQVRGRTEALAEPLSAEDQAIQSMPDVSPTKWHRGHTSWFFETFLLQSELEGYHPFSPAFGYLFNSYYETVGSRHPRAERGLVSRPGVAEVAAYRAHVDTAMEELLRRQLRFEVAELVELGLVHEEQHQELILMDIKHVLSRNPLRPAYRTTLPGHPPPARKAEWIEHAGGDVEIGAGPNGFAFDNERPRHVEHLVPFALADRSVTCGEWQEFMEDGGYHRPELWLSDGWARVQQARWEHPLYWERSAEDRPWQVFTLFGPRPLVPTEPVCHISLYEADAFAHWAGVRLPTEAEWEVATPGLAASPAATCAENGQDAAGPTVPNHALHPTTPAGAVWEWTSSAYAPYPGFRPAAGAVGEYNGKFMVNQYVLRGGCCATPPGHARSTYRNFFSAGSRWMFSGVRLARDL